MAHKNTFSAFLLLLLGTCSYAQRENLFFRRDYTYIKETESFYKIQTIPRNFVDAIDVCESEGASLFYPEDDAEANAVIDLWTRTQKPVSDVTIGIAAFIATGIFETIDGRPIADVYNNWAPGEPNNANGNENCVILVQNGYLNDVNCEDRRPFICKKTLSSLTWNYDCNMPYADYKFEPSTGKCYKFGLNPTTWLDAYSSCNSELSYLAIINSQTEADALVTLTNEAPKEEVEGSYLRGAVHLGFRKLGQHWITIKGTKLEDSGYAKWGPGQPDNAGGAEYCGSMFYSGPLNDINCSEKMFYICEHDVQQIPQT